MNPNKSIICAWDGNRRENVASHFAKNNSPSVCSSRFSFHRTARLIRRTSALCSAPLSTTPHIKASFTSGYHIWGITTIHVPSTAAPTTPTWSRWCHQKCWTEPDAGTIPTTCAWTELARWALRRASQGERFTPCLTNPWLISWSKVVS